MAAMQKASRLLISLVRIRIICERMLCLVFHELLACCSFTHCCSFTPGWHWPTELQSVLQGCSWVNDEAHNVVGKFYYLDILAPKEEQINAKEENKTHAEHPCSSRVISTDEAGFAPRLHTVRSSMDRSFQGEPQFRDYILKLPW